ncbi:5'-3' exonuclease [Austwickia chelonae]|uniref:5'-3' exonuclease n=1 Tax=Austwickia chelonae NBRC 105200 TaxID=1184607 RepID=K6ULE0_9MICO|nr:5'-3' exonuclease [Austwickia chelonae]GAB77166.1 putative 5'-3' exonuclease [Austwickia chelonae NBRC 105200]SEW04280.1 5'-3' exonuclease [Austwickia chelonae]
MSSLMLVDAAGLYYRAFYGVPAGRERVDQVRNNAVRGFLDMMASLIGRRRPGGVIACWDADWRPAFRVEAISSYKTHRCHPDGSGREDVPVELAEQVPVIAAALDAVGIARVGVPGYEADDVIGSYVAACRDRPIEIVTGDRDLFQLVDDTRRVKVVYTARGGVRDSQVVDESWLAEHYGVSSGRAYADLAVLRGDPSDGLPGVAGIGEKTGAKLLAAFGSLAGLVAAIDAADIRLKGAQARRLRDARAYLDAAPTVVRVASDCPLPPGVDGALPRRIADPRTVSELALSHRLTSNFSRLMSALQIP